MKSIKNFYATINAAFGTSFSVMAKMIAKTNLMKDHVVGF